MAEACAQQLGYCMRQGSQAVKGTGIRTGSAVTEYLGKQDNPASGEPLFLSQKGGAISSYAVWYTVKRYAALAEVERVTPHTFRHTVAMQLVRDPERYSQPSAEDLEKAAKILR